MCDAGWHVLEEELRAGGSPSTPLGQNSHRLRPTFFHIPPDYAEIKNIIHDQNRHYVNSVRPTLLTARAGLTNDQFLAIRLELYYISATGERTQFDKGMPSPSSGGADAQLAGTRPGANLPTAKNPYINSSWSMHAENGASQYGALTQNAKNFSRELLAAGHTLSTTLEFARNSTDVRIVSSVPEWSLTIRGGRAASPICRLARILYVDLSSRVRRHNMMNAGLAAEDILAQNYLHPTTPVNVPSTYTTSPPTTPLSRDSSSSCATLAAVIIAALSKRESDTGSCSTMVGQPYPPLPTFMMNT
ncbi:hypothetical protein DOTSEDRAFT_33303 [Dothistroma septosporum NZE10]|uniref:Uncharacterized protein n=1 Tax=Dothistroma septosporum (strain NZE10 / CBS 128990) TaxID=675120 RepID=N1PWI5_DOTSN|nr:hypothetical protein DOTSEDRAFT_33303 [Dothistroma septosporum NZE10]